MNAGELIDALHAAGGTLTVVEGKPRLQGAKIPEELKAALKANRDAVLAEWQRRAALSKDRYGDVPTGTVPMLARDAELTVAQRERVTQYVFRQPRPVHAWVMARANSYHVAGVKVEECDACACLDVLLWQRGFKAVKEVPAWLAGIEECAVDLQTNKNNQQQPTKK